MEPFHKNKEKNFHNINENLYFQYILMQINKFHENNKLKMFILEIDSRHKSLQEIQNNF